MTPVRDSDFGECFADRRVQQASAEVNFQSALYDPLSNGASTVFSMYFADAVNGSDAGFPLR